MRAVWSLVLVGLLSSSGEAAPADVDGLLAAGKRAAYSGQWDRAIRRLRAGVADAKRVGRAVDEARLSVELARVLIERNFFHVADRPGALKAAEEALASAERAKADAVVAEALLQLTRLAYTQAREDKNWERPVGLARRALALFEKIGSRAGIANAYYMLGLIDQMQERWEPARQWFDKQVALAREIGDKDILSNGRRHLGYVYMHRKEWDRAAEEYAQSLRLREEIGSTVTVPFAMTTLGELEWSQLGKRDAAVRRLERAIAIARRSKSTRAEYQARLALAAWLLELGRRDAARTHARAARRAAKKFGSTSAVEEADRLLAAPPPKSGDGT